MKKETVTDKLIKHFYGITGPLDEYKRREVDKIGNVAFIWLSWVLLIGNAITLILGYRYPKTIAIVYPILLEVILMGLFGFVIWKGRQAQVSEFDKEELTEKEQQKLRYSGLKSGIFFGTWMHLWTSLTEILSGGGKFLVALLDPYRIVSSLISGLLFGLSMHVVIKLRQKHSED